MYLLLGSCFWQLLLSCWTAPVLGSWQLSQLSLNSHLQSAELLHDWRFTANQFILATSPLRLMTYNFFFNWTLAVIILWREDGCVIYNCCWSTPAQLFSWPHFNVSDSRSLYLYPSGVWWPGYIPRHWVPFLLPPTTRRATVEVFDPTSTQDWLVLFTWRLSLYNLDMDVIENTTFNSSSIAVACIHCIAILLYLTVALRHTL
jgi:hypothetical protein